MVMVTSARSMQDPKSLDHFGTKVPCRRHALTALSLALQRLLILVRVPAVLLRWTRASPWTALSGEGKLIYSCQGSVSTLGLDHVDSCCCCDPFTIFTPPLRFATLHLVRAIMFSADEVVRGRKGALVVMDVSKCRNCWRRLVYLLLEVVSVSFGN